METAAVEAAVKAWMEVGWEAWMEADGKPRMMAECLVEKVGRRAQTKAMGRIRQEVERREIKEGKKIVSRRAAGVKVWSFTRNGFPFGKTKFAKELWPN